MRNSDKIKQQVFIDDQIKSSSHDEIVIWLYEKLKNEEYVRSLLKIPKETKIELSKPSIEPPIIIDNYKMAYADIGIFIKLYTGKFNKRTDESGKWVDADEQYNTIMAMFEVKTFVNIGETIRQINFVRAKKDFKWFVCAPPFAQSGILEEQGIGFIEYKKPDHL